jgi:hypothetical protein
MLNWAPPKLDREIRGVKLTDQQYDDYARIAGRAAKMQLNQIVARPGFDQMPANIRLIEMRKAVEAARHMAASAMIMQGIGTDHDIAQKAIENRRTALEQGRKVAK